MSGTQPLVMEETGVDAGREVFALTDEQILGMEGEDPVLEKEHSGQDSSALNTARTDRLGADGKSEQLPHGDRSGQAGIIPQNARDGAAMAVPRWLAERMRDPWVGDEARELWEGVQRAQREAAAYRETFASPEDARALKEIYPGGVAEAKLAAERARALEEIDAAFFGAPGRPLEEMRAGRAQLVEKLYAQEPGAFREMVEAGVRLLEGSGNGRKVASDEWRVARENSRSLADARDDGGELLGGEGKGAQPGMAVPQEVVSGYREFERAANAELERSVGGTITRAMEQALPNLRMVGREGQAAPLQERLSAAVREEVEAALKSDAQLGEQVARVLNGRRFDATARSQVVRLIDARAQQLVPGAVRRVVGSWTQATLGTRKAEVEAEKTGSGERASRAVARGEDGRHGGREEKSKGSTGARSAARGLVDYRKWSDEQILEM
jgi:hypothetical protein